MTESFGSRPPNGQKLLIAWLTPLGSCGVTKPIGVTLPYHMVNRVAGSDDKITDTGTYSIHTFAADYATAEELSWDVHDHIETLGPPFAPQRRVTLPSGQIVFADRVETDQTPFHLDYGVEPLERFVARYIIELRFAAA